MKIFRTNFCEGEVIYLDGTASQFETKYFLHIYRRPIGSSDDFTWVSMQNDDGEEQGEVGRFNLSELFSTSATPLINFEAGYQYRVNLIVSIAVLPG